MKEQHNLLKTLGRSGALRWSGENSETSYSIPTNPRERFRCIVCDERFADDVDALPLYQCGCCGTQFTPETSHNLNNQCPDCYRFAEKVTDCGCPDCHEGELVEIEDHAATDFPGGAEAA